jgi:hypothetical protein
MPSLPPHAQWPPPGAGPRVIRTPGAGGGSAEQGVKFAGCMRSHGAPTFPDPVSSLPSCPAGLSLVFGLRGAVIAIPNTINPQSPTFKQAAKACQFPGA